jgi:hypothetical protein
MAVTLLALQLKREVTAYSKEDSDVTVTQTKLEEGIT